MMAIPHDATRLQEDNKSVATVDAVIVGYNETILLAAAISSVLNAGVRRVLVWENGNTSVAELQACVEEQWQERVEIVASGENLGFGRANNAALRRLLELGHSDYILLLNPDAQISAASLDLLIAEEGRLGPAILAPAMRLADGAKGTSGGPFPSVFKELATITGLLAHLPIRIRGFLKRLYYAIRRGSDGKPRDTSAGTTARVDWVSGFCMLMPTAAAISLGPFDERYFLYFEDVDLSKRAAAQGIPSFIVNGAVADHAESATTQATKSGHYRDGYTTYLAIHGSALLRALARRMKRRAVTS